MAERKKTVDAAVEAAAVEETTPATAAEEATAPAAAEEAPAEEKPEKVPVRLVYDDDHKRPLFVCVNGVSMRIERGKTVMVPVEFAAAVENAMEQEENSVRYSDAMAYKGPDDN